MSYLVTRIDRATNGGPIFTVRRSLISRATDIEPDERQQLSLRMLTGSPLARCAFALGNFVPGNEAWPIHVDRSCGCLLPLPRA